jgi:RNA polymerase sigma factor (sigma-70 family)
LKTAAPADVNGEVSFDVKENRRHFSARPKAEGFRSMNDPPIRDDEQLIELFLAGASDDAEAAFETLVARHRPAVVTVCQRLLDQPEDAEDAAQATFVALVRNAGRIRDRRMLASWLYGVAYRIASRMKARAARRSELHGQASGGVSPVRADDDDAFRELRQLVQDEVDQLPEDFRTLVVHSYLEGKSNEEVARSLGCPIGTVKGRLWRAREMLRERLSRRVGGAVEVFA